MANKNQPDLTEFFRVEGGEGDFFDRLRKEEEMKKLAAAKAAPKPPGTERPDFNDQPKTGLPAARPTSPLTPVRDVAAREIHPSKQIQRKVDLAPPVEASPLMDVTNKVVDFVRRKMTEQESKSSYSSERDPEKLKNTREVYKEFSRGATGR